MCVSSFVYFHVTSVSPHIMPIMEFFNEMCFSRFLLLIFIFCHHWLPIKHPLVCFFFLVTSVLLSSSSFFFITHFYLFFFFFQACFILNISKSILQSWSWRQQTYDLLPRWAWSGNPWMRLTGMTVQHSRLLYHMRRQSTLPKCRRLLFYDYNSLSWASYNNIYLREDEAFKKLSRGLIWYVNWYNYIYLHQWYKEILPDKWVRWRSLWQNLSTQLRKGHWMVLDFSIWIKIGDPAFIRWDEWD